MPTHPLQGRRRSPAPAARTAAWAPPWRRVPRRALVDFTRSLAVLLGARLPLTQALATSRAQCRNQRLSAVLGHVEQSIRAGRSLSASLAAFPHVFDALYVHLTRAGEAAGRMDEVLLRLADHLEKAATLRRRVRLALVYPALVLAVAGGATTFLLAVIVPTFADMFADFGAVLPAPTRLVLSLSDALRRHAAVGVAGACVAAAAVGLARREPAGRRAADRLLLALPLVGRLALGHLVARFCRTLGTLLTNGVGLLDALEILAKVVDNRVVGDEVERLAHHVRRGSSVHRPLQRAGLFPAMVIQMIAVGEQTAELDRMLLHAADHYEGEVDTYVDALTAVLEPALILVLGVVLGGLLVALYLPMFDLIGTVR